MTKISYVILGEEYLDHLEEYDVIIKAPGISFAGMDIEEYAHKITSQLELLLEFFDVFTIGVTGTKGKSTTSSLIYQILQDQGKKSILLGNIGVPVFDFIEELTKDTIIVLEMSSHQLEYMKTSPNIAILLNIFPDHLDHYNSYEDYAKAKCNIYKHQKGTDYFLYNSDNEMIQKVLEPARGKIYSVSFERKEESKIYVKDNTVFLEDKPIYDTQEPRKLVGDYILNNMMFILGVSEILGLDLRKTANTINQFEPLRHRLQLVGNYDGIFYYDNSIATIPKATIEAVKALQNVDTLIIGGMDRGIDYTELIEFVNQSEMNNIICMPKTGHDIANQIEKKTYLVNTMEEAVVTAKQVTQKGKSCLLSPAAASYGFFKNFEEKGDIYQELVKTIL
ncbi:MAG: UDP-N-acetylmuramoyl-L-alanine--D-glutamate ligase [Clostridia bacterium]|nr:UDP-N-acetylmuramoyl-L-alanine--D-glutamate ligase [Clostridia bacterium]